MVSRNTHPSEMLWKQHSPRTYPSGLIRVPRAIPGPAFFPGGYGLSGAAKNQPLPEFPANGVMVLGHDFDSEVEYKKSYERGFEDLKANSTWRELTSLFLTVNLLRETCFFTNFYMGLRQGNNSQGKNPGASDKPFVMHCERFLCEQIRVQRPSLIVTLGLWVPRAIAAISPELQCWSGTKEMTIKELDASGPLINDVTFHGVPNLRTVVVALVHPAHRPANVLKRRYRNSAGNEFFRNDAEVEMLQDAIALSELRRDCN